MQSRTRSGRVPQVVFRRSCESRDHAGASSSPAQPGQLPVTRATPARARWYNPSRCDSSALSCVSTSRHSVSPSSPGLSSSTMPLRLPLPPRHGQRRVHAACLSRETPPPCKASLVHRISSQRRGEARRLHLTCHKQNARRRRTSGAAGPLFGGDRVVHPILAARRPSL